MKTKNLVFATFLITLGLVLNLVTPAFIGMMKPDFLLAMYLIALTQLKETKERVVVMLVCALLSSMTSVMPGAEIANFIEKILTGITLSSVYGLIEVKANKFDSVLVGGGGTLISGFYFLMIMNLLGFLNENLVLLLLSVVIPTSVVNMFVFVIFQKAMRIRRN